MSSRIRSQIAKDAELLATKGVLSVNWHFYKSQATGLAGPSPSVQKAVEVAGIGVFP
jgi:hypothetical protein